MFLCACQLQWKMNTIREVPRSIGHWMLRFRRGGRHHIGVSPNSWNKAPSVTAHRFVSSDVEGKCCPARTSVHGTDRKGTHATITVNQTHRRLGQLVQDLSSKHSPHNRAASVHTQDLTSSSGEQREPNQQRCSTDSKKDSRCNSGSDKQGCVSTDEGGNLNVEDEHSKVVQFLHRHGMNMNTISMVATWLCVLDCTVLPVVLTALPIVGILTPQNIELVQHVLHHVSLYFVLPVGGMALATNYQQHRRKDVLALGLGGLTTIVASNAPGGIEIIPHAWHTVANTAGCFTLLSSQWWSRKLINDCCGEKPPENHSH